MFTITSLSQAALYPVIISSSKVPIASTVFPLSMKEWHGTVLADRSQKQTVKRVFILLNIY